MKNLCVDIYMNLCRICLFVSVKKFNYSNHVLTIYATDMIIIMIHAFTYFIDI